MYNPQKDPSLPTVNQSPKIISKIESIKKEFEAINCCSIQDAIGILESLGEKYGEDAMIRFVSFGYDGAVEYVIDYAHRETEEEAKIRYEMEIKKQASYIKKQELKHA